MRRIAAALFLGLLGAGVVHIAILFLLPHLSERSAWNRLAAIAGPYETIRIDGQAGGPILQPDDPSFVAVACAFDLRDGAVQVTSSAKVPFWSASVYDRDATGLFSLTDRSAPDGTLDLVVLTSDQMIRTRRDKPEELEESVFAELPVAEGMVVVRAMVPEQSWRDRVAEFAAGIRCDPR